MDAGSTLPSGRATCRKWWDCQERLAPILAGLGSGFQQINGSSDHGMTVVNHNNHLLTPHLRHNSPKASNGAGLIAFGYLSESKLTSNSGFNLRVRECGVSAGHRPGVVRFPPVSRAAIHPGARLSRKTPRTSGHKLNAAPCPLRQWPINPCGCRASGRRHCRIVPTIPHIVRAVGGCSQCRK